MAYTIEETRRLDIQTLVRAGLLAVGEKRRGTVPVGAQDVECATGANAAGGVALLSYSVRAGRPTVIERLPVMRSPLPHDRFRWLWVCPACERPCAALHRHDGYFACRLCHGLRYRSTMLRPQRRADLRAQRILARSGIESVEVRPRGMHRRTFERVVQQVAELRSVA